MVLHGEVIKGNTPISCISWYVMVKSSREIPQLLCIMMLRGGVIKGNTTDPVDHGATWYSDQGKYPGSCVS